MRDSIAESINSVVDDLYEDGFVDEITMRNIHNLCLPDIKEYRPEDIVALRKQVKLSQAALAAIFNVSLSTVQKWERGKKSPTGSSRKLLDIVERKGIEVLI